MRTVFKTNIENPNSFFFRSESIYNLCLIMTTHYTITLIRVTVIICCYTLPRQILSRDGKNKLNTNRLCVMEYEIHIFICSSFPSSSSFYIFCIYHTFSILTCVRTWMNTVNKDWQKYEPTQKKHFIIFIT